MNVGELLRERDRLLALMEEAKTAKTKLRQINILIAMYGDDEKVSLNGAVPVSQAIDALPEVPGATECDICGDSFKGKAGLAMHKNKAHGIVSASASAVRQRNRVKGH
jgi:hypothetical protein